MYQRVFGKLVLFDKVLRKVLIAASFYIVFKKCVRISFASVIMLPLTMNGGLLGDGRPFTFAIKDHNCLEFILGGRFEQKSSQHCLRALRIVDVAMFLACLY